MSDETPIEETGTTPPPRLRRRFFGGYDRDDVHAALAGIHDRVEVLIGEVDASQRRIEELEQQLEGVRQELEAYRIRESELAAVMDQAEAVLRRAEQATLPAPPRASG